MASSSQQPKLEPHDVIAQRLYELCDQIIDCGHASADIAVVPTKEDGSPDHSNAHPVNMEKPSSDSGPADMAEAERWVVLVDDIEACEPQTSMMLWVDLDTGNPMMEQASGPSDDADIAMRIIARDIGAEPPKKSSEPSALLRSWEEFIARREAPPVAANDNEPPEQSPHHETLVKYLAAFGGPDALVMGEAVYGAMLGHLRGQIRIVDGRGLFVSGGTSRFIDLPEKPKSLKIVDPTGWHGQHVPDREWFLPGLVPARNVTLLSGDGGVGKSLLALQIAAASALGVDTMGLTPRAGRVFYLGAEDEEDEFKRRLAQIVTGHGRTLAELDGNFRLSPMAGEDASLALPDRAKNMQPTEMMKSLIDEVTSFRPRLLILDTSADLFGGDEINRVQVRQFVGMLRKIAMGIDCAVILLSHPSVAGMQSGSGLSGSTAWNNSVRSRLYLTAVQDDDEARVLTTVKSNYGKKGGGIKMRWHNGTFVLDDGKPTAGASMLAAQAERVFCELLSMLTRQGRNVCHVPGTTYAPSVMAKLPEARGMTKARLVDAMNSLLANGAVKIVVEGPASRQRQRLILAAEDFGTEG